MDFPLQPTTGEQFIGTKNRVFEWDGDKWKKGKPRPPEVIAPVITPVVSDFWPSDPIPGEQVADSVGRTWQWDGEKWIGVSWVAREIEGPPGPPGPPGEIDWPLDGVTDGSNVEPGKIGEYIEASGSVTQILTTATASAVQIFLDAGDWDVEADGHFTTATGNLGASGLIIITGSAAGFPVASVPETYRGAASLQSQHGYTRRRLNLTVTTEINVVVKTTLLAAVANVTLFARRVR